MCVTPRNRWRAQPAARRPAASANSDCAFVLPAQKRSSALFSSRRGPMRGKPRVLTVMDIHFLSPMPPLFDPVVLYRSREKVEAGSEYWTRGSDGSIHDRVSRYAAAIWGDLRLWPIAGVRR